MKRLRNLYLAVPGVLTLVAISTTALSHLNVTSDERHLSFYHTHTGKRLDIVYARNGDYVPSAVAWRWMK